MIGEIPTISLRTAPYWQSGSDGRLRIARCIDCEQFIHPPRPICPRCLRQDIEFAPVSGRGIVYSYTINRYAWTEKIREPYVVAEIDLMEQPGLRLIANIVDCPVDQVTIGMNVAVTFEAVEDLWIPLFRPC